MPESSRSWGLIVFGALALPVLLAIWTLSWFVVQDGPLYLYNSHIILESLKSNSPLGQHYFVQWTPLPYWGAYALLVALMPVLSERAADQVLMTLTSVGLAGMICWLRWRVVGWQGVAIVAPLAVLLSISVLWLFGLYSFLLGTLLCLFTLGFFWKGRDQMGTRRAALLALLVVAGYFCHLVSLGLTVVGIIVLAVATPGPNLRRRLGWTALGILPLLPLIVMYRQLMRAGGEMKIQWMSLTDALSLKAWVEYMRAADFVRINHPEMPVPPGGLRETLWQLPSPTTWAAIALLVLIVAAAVARAKEDKSFFREHRGWIMLSALLLMGGLLGPDDVGGAHGGLLRERALLVGIACLVPVLRLNPKQGAVRIGFALLMIASIIQMGLIWDYASGSNILVSEIMKAKPYVGNGKRVAAMMVNPGWQYRTSPVTHTANLLGISTGNFIWNNYGPSLYYFPVRFRNQETGKLSQFVGSDLQFYDFTNAQTAGAALADWTAAMEVTNSEIDVLLVWGGTPEIAEINKRWFDPQPVYASENVMVLRHRSP